MLTREASLRQRLTIFPIIGLAFGFAFSVRALVVSGLAMALMSPPHLPVPLLLAYPLSGAVSGIVVAMAFPLVRWIGGAFIVGVVAMFPVYLAVALTVAPDSWTNHLELSAGVAVFVGGIVGVRAWMEENRRRHRLAHVWLFAVVSTIVASAIGKRWAGQWPAVAGILLFLIPVSLAVMVTMDKGVREEPFDGAGAA